MQRECFQTQHHRPAAIFAKMPAKRRAGKAAGPPPPDTASAVDAGPDPLVAEGNKKLLGKVAAA
eukprot:8270555-Alexandrium_andersonii.AAC.1